MDNQGKKNTDSKNLRNAEYLMRKLSDSYIKCLYIYIYMWVTYQSNVLTQYLNYSSVTFGSLHSTVRLPCLVVVCAVCGENLEVTGYKHCWEMFCPSASKQIYPTIATRPQKQTHGSVNCLFQNFWSTTSVATDPYLKRFFKNCLHKNKCTKP